MIDEIPLSRPDITDLEADLVLQVLRSGRLSMGPMLEEFETLVARRVGARHAVGVSSGTSALHLILKSLGIGPGDEVVTTPFSFVASANCILQVGAQPVFVDVEPRSMNMDPQRVKDAITPRTRAILAVEVFGNPAHMEDYQRIAAHAEIPLVEDSCEGLGGALGGRAIGAFGRAGAFGFYGNKQITTGEGGMIVTDDERLADMCRSYRNQGRPIQTTNARASLGPTQALHHERMGYNYRLSELQAAVGVAQMRRLDGILERRAEAASFYMRRLMSTKDLTLPTIDPRVTMSWFVFVVRLAHEFTKDERDRIIEGLRRHDIGAADYFPCIHLQRHYREQYGFKPGDFPIAESAAARTIALPFHSRLTSDEVDFVAQTLELMISREGLKRS